MSEREPVGYLAGFPIYFTEEENLDWYMVKVEAEEILNPTERFIKEHTPTFHATDGKIHGPCKWYCVDESGYTSTYILPKDIFDRLGGGSLGKEGFSIKLDGPTTQIYREYETMEEAMAALREALTSTTPGGLIVPREIPELEKPKKVVPRNPQIQCAFCKKESIDKERDIGLFWYKTKDGFALPTPTCRHGRYAICPDCRKTYPGCPICGCKTEYT